MQDIKNKEIDKWIRPWEIEKFDDLYNRDERFFALVIKGALAWFNRNILLYNKSVRHFIFNTGSSYLYVEQNGYNFSWSETTGEENIYMQLPRCIVVPGDINIPMDELTQPFVRSTYERRSGNEIKGYNAETRRLPIELSLSFTYVLANFNESMILIQELLDKVVFQKYFSIVYLGQTIECSIEVPQNFHIELNKIDMTGTETNQKTIAIEIKVCTNYPILNERTEVANEKILSSTSMQTSFYNGDVENTYEEINKTFK